MTDIITTLHPENDADTNLYPNIVKDNIPNGSIDTSKLDSTIINLLNNIGELHPSGVDTASNILSKTTDDGIWVGSDTGNWYYWDGTHYVSGGEYIANTDELTELKIALPLENITEYNHLENSGSNINASIRFLANHAISKNTIIESVDIFVGNNAYSSGTIHVEVWGLTSPGTITKRHSVSMNNNNITGNVNIPVNYLTIETSYIVVYRIGTFIPQVVFNASERNGLFFISNITSDTLSLSDMNQYSGHLSLKVNCIIQKNTQKLSNTIYVGSKGDFTNIQEAINSIVDDASNNPYTIIVDKGTYSRFSMRSSVTGISRMRYISIIGIDKMQCKIYDDTGHYITGSCDLWTYGTLENLTIEVNHNNDSSEPNRKAYALHMDFGQCNAIIRNCILKSNNGPAVGIGMYQDTTITFENCDIYSNCPSDYTALLNYGALFCHGNTSSGITNQLLNVYNCRIISENGDRGAWISNPGHNDVKINSINSLYYTGNSEGTAVVLDEVNKTPYSYGNSASNLNVL